MRCKAEEIHVKIGYHYNFQFLIGTWWHQYITIVAICNDITGLVAWKLRPNQVWNLGNPWDCMPMSIQLIDNVSLFVQQLSNYVILSWPTCHAWELKQNRISNLGNPLRLYVNITMLDFCCQICVISYLH